MTAGLCNKKKKKTIKWTVIIICMDLNSLFFVVVLSGKFLENIRRGLARIMKPWLISHLTQHTVTWVLHHQSGRAAGDGQSGCLESSSLLDDSVTVSLRLTKTSPISSFQLFSLGALIGPISSSHKSKAWTMV